MTDYPTCVNIDTNKEGKMILELKSFEMIAKSDIPGGYQCILEYGDDTQLSIIKGTGAYGGEQGLYEIGVFKNGDLAEMPGITWDGDTVKGYLTEKDVDAIIKKMYLVTGKTPSQV